jgi:hypothetical protein
MGLLIGIITLKKEDFCVGIVFIKRCVIRILVRKRKKKNKKNKK